MQGSSHAEIPWSDRRCASVSATVSISMREELATLVGSANASDREVDLERCTVDDVSPAVVVSPSTPTEAAAVVRYAAQHDATVLPAGGSSRRIGGNTPERSDIVLSTSR